MSIASKPRRSKFITFTYIWQVGCAVLFVGAIAAAVFAWRTQESAALIALILDALVFVIQFFIAFSWRSSARIRQAIRDYLRGVK